MEKRAGLLSVVLISALTWIQCTAPGAGLGFDDHDVRGASDGGSSSSSGGDGPGGGNEPTGLPCDVDAILKTRCAACHGENPSAGASAPLVTWEDLQKPYQTGKIVDAVKKRIHAETSPMPPSPRLTDAELAVLDKWIDDGAKESDASCDNETPPDVEPLNCDDGELTQLKPSAPFVMEPNAPLDQYICFGVDVPRAEKHHVIAGGPLVDNKKILHHILVFQSDKTEDPTPKPCAATASATWVMMGGWAPGGKNLVLPPEAGFPEEAGTTHWVLQLHYNNALNLAGAKDQSGFQVCSTNKLRPNDAGVVAFGSLKFTIPPRANHTIVCSYPWLHGEVNFVSAAPHMHKRGMSLSTERVPILGGAPEMIAEQKAFDFESQVGFKVSGKAKRGDIMRTRCAWKNPTDSTVTWGEGTDDEMCFNFLTYYPKSASLLSWALPSAAASCKVE